MDTAAGVAATRAGSLPMSSACRKEWRAISEHHLTQNVGDEDLERPKLGQADERTIYENEREPADVDFCSITVDGGLDNDILQQRLNSVTRQREELQQMEIDLRAQVIARSEIVEMQRTFDAQIKEHVNTASMLQERLSESDQVIHELERKIEEKDRELHAIRLEKEASWAKEDLLREQNKELATFRRERDHSEVERAQHIKQMHDLQEHIQEKERQLVELQEQYRASQETILYKDEQLREAQAWVARAQEMDALQSSTNQSLQAELRERTEQFNQLWVGCQRQRFLSRERTEQFNQLWVGCQRQFAEMERLHLHSIQQLQLELADVRERNGTYTDESRISQNSKETLQLDQHNGSQGDGLMGGTTKVNTGPLPNGASNNVSSVASAGNSSSQNDHVASVSITPSSMLGMHTYLPPGQMAALHSFVMHQQGLPHTLPSPVPQAHVGHFFSMPPMSSIQQWPNHQRASEVTQVSVQNQLPPSRSDKNLASLDSNYEYEMSVNGQGGHSDYLDHASQVSETVSSSTGKAQVLESIGSNYLAASQSEQTLQQVSSQFHDALRLSSLEESEKSKEQKFIGLKNNGLEHEVSAIELANAAGKASLFDASAHTPDAYETKINNGTSAVWTEPLVSTGQASVAISGKTSDVALLDEGALLACVVRTIPAGGRIRISSTLPNRLGKMLAPLHWHDYKKKYGKLDDFIGGHPELFVIEDDYIWLREGAQEKIAASAAVAKVAAAAAAESPYSSLMPSVAVTPMAQPNRLKKALTVDSNHVKHDNIVFKSYASDDHSLMPPVQSQQPNGVYFGAAGNIKILSKSKDSIALNGASYEALSVSSTESKASLSGKPSTQVIGKQQNSRTTGGIMSCRR